MDSIKSLAQQKAELEAAIDERIMQLRKVCSITPSHKVLNERWVLVLTTHLLTAKAFLALMSMCMLRE
jgi:hypothetical protein